MRVVNLKCMNGMIIDLTILWCEKTIVTNDDCCARHILAAQEDFKANKPLLQEVIESMGHKVIFYSKFHPELNFIEQYWGAAKRYTIHNNIAITPGTV